MASCCEPSEPIEQFEGSIPITTGPVTRAHAPGNGFASLMTSVATDYTEIMSLLKTTQSSKIALFLALATVPQVILFFFILSLAETV
jgi:hypothetical protein